jgi:Rho-binding antiterminator
MASVNDYGRENYPEVLRMDEYTLVSCDFHDQLEAWATLRQICQIIYQNEANETIGVQGRIVDVYAADKADFLKLDNGTIIRLDKVISVNGKRASSCLD